MATRRFTPADLLAISEPANREPPQLSVDGALLAITVRTGGPDQRLGYDDPYTPDGVPVHAAGARVLLVDTTTGEAVRPYPDAASSWGPRWSPDGSLLACYVQPSGRRPCLGIWHRDSGTVRLLPHALVRPFFGFEVPQWTPDNRGILVKLVSASTAGDSASTRCAAEAESSAITVWTTDGNPAADAPSSAGFLETYRCDLALVDVTSGAVRTLVAGHSLIGCRLAPDGHAVAAFLDTGPTLASDDVYADLVVVDVGGGSVRTVAPRICQEYAQGFAWSPDSRRIAYVDQRDRDATRMYVVDSDGASSPVELTADTGATRLPELLVGGYDAPRWSRDGQHLVLPARGGYVVFATTVPDVWRVVDTGDSRAFVGRVQRQYEPTVTTCADGSLLDIVRDAENRNLVVRRVDLETGAVEDLWEMPAAWLTPPYGMELHPDLSQLYLWLESSQHPPQVWRFSSDAGAGTVFHDPNPQLAGVEWGRSSLVSWRSADGQLRQGTLLLPANSTGGAAGAVGTVSADGAAGTVSADGAADTIPERPMPLVVDVYGGRLGSDGRHAFGGGSYVLNGQLLASRGYAVLWPDLPMTGEDPLRRLAGLVPPAVTALVDHGLVDPDRIGVMGQSNGGYCTLGLLTQSSLFRAGVCVAGGANLVSLYGTLTARGDSRWMGYLETDEQGIGGSLWERREAYIDNSPLFRLDRVTAAVLLACGTANPEEPSQAGEAFSALRRLGKVAEFRLYAGEDHAPGNWTAAHRRDLLERILDWFDAHLGPAAHG